MLNKIMEMLNKIVRIFSKVWRMINGLATSPGSGWWMSGANQFHTGFGYTRITVPLEVAWQIELPLPDPPYGNASQVTLPVFGKDKVLVSRGLPGKLYAISTRDGSTLWSFQDFIESGDKTHLREAAVVASHNVFGVFESQPAGRGCICNICALGEDNGNLLWRKHLAEGELSFSINMWNGKIFTKTISGKGYVINQNTSATEWTASLPVPPGGGSWISPLAFLSDVVFTGESVAHAYDARSGERRWAYNFDAPIIGGSAIYGHAVITYTNQIPVVIIAGIVRNDNPPPHNDILKVYCIGAENGEERWKYTADVGDTNNQCNAVVSYDNLLVATGGHVLAFSIITSELIWSHQAPARISAAPACSNGILYYLAENNVLYGIRIQDQAELWNAALPGEYNRGNEYGVAVDQGLVVVTHSSSMVSAFKSP